MEFLNLDGALRTARNFLISDHEIPSKSDGARIKWFSSCLGIYGSQSTRTYQGHGSPEPYCFNSRKSKTDKLKAGQSLTVSGSLIKARDKKKNSPLEAFKASTAELLNDTVLSRIITISDDQVQQNPKVGSLKETILVNRVNKQSKMLTSVTLKRIIILSEQFVASKRPMKSIKLPFNFSFT